MPKNVSDIDEWTFGCMYNLKRIEVDAENPNYSSVDGVLYNKDCSELLCYPANKSEKVFTVPDSVKRIATYAWEYCGNLEVLNIPASVSEMHISKNVYGLPAPFQNLKEINVDQDNKQYASVDGVLYNKEVTTLLYYPVCKGSNVYRMDGVKFFL